MKNFLQVNQLFGTVGSPNQTGETLTRENRVGLMSYLRRTIMLLFAVLVMSIANIGMAWGAGTQVTFTANATSGQRGYVAGNDVDTLIRGQVTLKLDSLGSKTQTKQIYNSSADKEASWCLSSSSTSNANKNYIELKASSGYNITGMQIRLAANGTTESRCIAVCFGSAFSMANNSVLDTISIPLLANNNDNSASHTITLSGIPSGTGCIRIYKVVRYDGTNKKLLNSGGTQIWASSSPQSLVVPWIKATYESVSSGYTLTASPTVINPMTEDSKTGAITTTITNSPVTGISSGTTTSTSSNTFTVAKATPVTVTAPATVDGSEEECDYCTYRFDSWENIPASVTADVSNIHAKYITTYDLAYNLDGGDWADAYSAPEYYVYGTGVTLPVAANVEKEGYNFDGWTLDYDDSDIEEVDDETWGGVSVTAHWSLACSDLDAPTGLECVDQSYNTLSFSWDAVANASSYDVKLWTNSTCTGDPVKSANTTNTTCRIRDLSSSTTYYCKVQTKGDGSTYCTSGGTTATAASGTTLSGTRKFKSGERIYFKDDDVIGGACMKYSGDEIWAVFNGTGDWIKGQLESGDWNTEGAIYYFDVPGVGQEYDFVIFTRNGWGIQTGNESTDIGKNMFVLTSYDGNKTVSGTWSKYASGAALIGDFNDWDPDQGKFVDGRVILDLEAETDYEFKVLVGDGTDDNNYWACDLCSYITNTTLPDWALLYKAQSNNFGLTTGEAGEYCFHWNNSTHYLGVYYPQARLEKGKYIYFDARDNTTWTGNDDDARFWFKYYDSNSNYPDDATDYTCTKANATDTWVYPYVVPASDYIGQVQVNRYKNGLWAADVDKIQAYTRTSSLQNCIKMASGSISAVSWTTYCPPMNTPSLSDNGTTTYAGNGTAGTPYIVKTGDDIKVQASSTSTIADLNMKAMFDFQDDGSTVQNTTATTCTFAASSTDGTAYVLTVDAYNTYNETNSTKATSSTTLYYTAKDIYNITYKCGSNSTGDDIVDHKIHGTNITLRGNTTFSRTGYNLVGWSTTDGGTKAHNVGATYSTDAALTLYPVWEAKTTTITLDPNTSAHGSSGDGGATATFDSGTLTSVSHTTAETGYHCVGYFTSSDEMIITAEGALVKNTTYTTNEETPKWKSELSSLTLYAHYEINTYTVNIASNNDSYGTVNVASISSVEHGEEVSIDGNVLTLNETDVTATKTADGADYSYAFSGWSVSNGDAITGNTNITATFTATAKQYSVTHSLTNMTASSGATGANAATYGTNYTATLNASSGYARPASITVTCGGDDITEDCTWNSSTGALTIPGTSILGNITITAAGELVYTVTFESNGGSSVASITQASEGASITMPSAPTYASHTFVDWVIGSTTKEAGASYTPTANVTAYARWKETCAGGGGGSTTLISYTITAECKSSDPCSETASGTPGGTAYLYKMSSSNDKFKLNTDPKDGNPGSYFALKLSTGYFQAGDVLTMDGSKAMEVYTGTHGSGTLLAATSAPSDGVISYTLPNTLPNNTNEIYVYRSSSTYNGTLTYMTVTRAGGGSGTCYYVTYDGNGADGGLTCDPTAYAANDDPEVLDNGDGGSAYTRSNYTFDGWYTKAVNDGTGTAYAPGATITDINDNITLYAQWREACSSTPAAPSSLTNGATTTNTQVVTWTANGENTWEVYHSTSSSTPNTDQTPTATVTSATYTFTGLTASTQYYWWARSKCDASHKSSWIAGTSFTTSAATYTLTATAKTNMKGTFSGSKTITNSPVSSVTAGTTIATSSNTFTVGGSTTVAAPETIAGTVEVDDGGTPYNALCTWRFSKWNNIVTPVAGDESDIEAEYVPTFAINYILDGGTINEDYPTYYIFTDNEEDEISLPTNVTKANYTFDHWVDAWSNTRSKITCDYWGDFNLTAVWTAKTSPGSGTVSGTTSICSGDNTDITLSASVSGASYQLYKGEDKVGDAKAGTGSALTWSVSEIGTYTVKAVETATHASGDMSGSVVISASTATSISTQPTTAVSGHDGVDFTLGSDLAATGEGTLTYQWYSYTSSDGAGQATVGSATTTKTLTTSKAAGTYYYKVGVIGACGEVKSNMITVTIDNEHLLTYDAGSGSGAPSGNWKSPGSMTLPADLPTRSGYIFLGWNTKNDGTGDMYQPSGSFTMPSSATTLYAAWASPCFTITDAARSSTWSDKASGATIESSDLDGTITGGTVINSGSVTMTANDTRGMVFNSNDREITITLTNGMFQEGTVIAIGGKTNNSNSTAYGFAVSGNATTPATYTTTAADYQDFTVRYVVTADDGIEGTSSFALKRANSNQVYLKTIYIGGCMSCTGITPTLSYSATTLYAFGGTPHDARPTLTGNTGNGDVTYSSSNTDVVTVDSETGFVTAVGAGTATVTAVIEANAGYCGAIKSVEFTVPALVNQSIRVGKSTSWNGDGSAAPDMTFNDPTSSTSQVAVIANNSYTFDATATSDKDNMTAKFTSTETSKNSSKYLTLKFKNATHAIRLGEVVVPIQPVKSNGKAQVEIYEGSTLRLTSSEVTDITQGKLNDVHFTFASPYVFAANTNIEVRLYFYGQTDGFRLGTPFYVNGGVLVDQRFTDANSTGLWSDPANWDGGSLPEIYHDVVIEKPVAVDIAHATAKSIVIYNNGSDKTGKLTIQPNKGLEVDGTIQKTTDGSTKTATGEADLVLESSSAGNASLIFNNSNSCQATVQMYSKASIVGETWNWQYVGTPFTGSIPLYNYYGSWMYKWNNGGWAAVRGDDELDPFVGYCLTQSEATTHVMGGTLIATDGNDQEITMSASKDMVLANSWTAPIYIGGFTETTFTSEPATIYLFNTGSAEEGSTAGTTEAGTYITVPVNSGPYVGTEFIPSMQGFFVTTNGGSAGTITMKYDELVRPADSRGIVAGSMKAPKRIEERPEVMKIRAEGSVYNDRVVILSREDFSQGFDNGWDGKKMTFGNASPSVYVINEQGGYDAVSAIPEYEGTVVGFRKGTGDEVYTISFNYDGDVQYYLNDLKEYVATPINEETEYTFTSAAEDAEARFIISKTPIHKTPTDIDPVTGDWSPVTGARKVIIDNKIYIIRGGRMYNATGALVK